MFAIRLSFHYDRFIMKKCLLVTNGFSRNPNNQYKIKRLTEEFHERGFVAETKDAIELLPYSDGNDTYLDLAEYAFAIDLDKDMYLARILSQKLPLFNSYESMMLSDDKMMSILCLRKSGIVAPITIPAPLCYAAKPDLDDVSRFLDKVENALSYPLVFKECHGSLGRQVLLIHDRKELEDVERKYSATQHLYEQFLSRHQGHDYRIIVIDGKVIACMERVNKDDFRSNIALGGKGYDVTSTLDDSFKEVALKATKALGLLYAGIDVGISDDDKPMFIEANGNAFFTEIEEVTHINIASILVDAILNKIKMKN
jgi:gamma-F420-2:alpha-L-glutamate ligase